MQGWKRTGANGTSNPVGPWLWGRRCGAEPGRKRQPPHYVLSTPMELTSIRPASPPSHSLLSLGIFSPSYWPIS